MKNILIKKFSMSLYCDVEFIQRMANLKNEPILNEEFLSQTEKTIYLDMYYLDNDDIDKIDKKNNRIRFFWTEDSLSIFELNFLTLKSQGELYTQELNFATNNLNEDIYIYIFLNYLPCPMDTL
ncbi:hypothetical protein ACT4R9_11000 [Ornithobacterium rhinotracheale]|uniref:hypothetical protein n=1 Tax=Ornithobacterium rhinotracheale TaxID=28251 RepID=UPI003FA465CA